MSKSILFKDYKKYETIVKNYDGKTLDTSKYNFLAPTTLIPLLAFTMKEKITDIKVNETTKDYVKKILRGEPTPTNTPFLILSKESRVINGKKVGTWMVEKIPDNYVEYMGSRSVSEIISELVDNIYDHTYFTEEKNSQGYTYAQIYPNAYKVDICIYDDGLSIPGRFTKSGIIYDDDCHAIEKAIGSISTKENSKERGNGLGTCLKLMEANQGEALIISRQGCLEINGNNKTYQYHHLNNKDYFKGTLITIRVANNPIQFYDVFGDGYIYNTPYKYNGDEKKCNTFY